MRLITAAGVGCLLSAASAHAQAARPVAFFSAPAAHRVAAAADTMAPTGFDLPARPLAEALGEFSRQADVRVRLDAAAAAGERSREVSGTFTAAEALRRMLEGTGFSAHFADARTVLVTGGDDATREFALTRITAVGERGRGYASLRTASATRTPTPLRDVPQAVSVVTRDAIADQAMQGMADVVRYVPGVSMGQGEGHRDAPTIRGNSSTADFFVDGVRDDAQYFRDLYNVERVEALKGSNAMIFGRGGGGGVINRAMKEADWTPLREIVLQGGSHHNRRMALDAGQGFTDRVAGRLNAVYESSDLFRDAVSVTRHGVHPTLTVVSPSGNTRATIGYENFSDHRTVDRGIPSFQGRPFETGVSTFFGNPALSYSDAKVHSSAATLGHRTAGFSIRNSTRFTSYRKFYQNVFPGAVSSEGSEVALNAYNARHDRRNLINQTDLSTVVRTGVVSHTLLVGAELGRQVTDNFRNTGYFDNGTTAFLVPVSAPTRDRK